MPHKTQSYSEVRGMSWQASRRCSTQEVPELPPVPCRRARPAFQVGQVDFFIDKTPGSFNNFPGFFIAYEFSGMKNPAVPKAFGTRYLIVRSYYFHIRSLTPQQAARNALAIRFKKERSGLFSNYCHSGLAGILLNAVIYTLKTKKDSGQAGMTDATFLIGL